MAVPASAGSGGGNAKAVTSPTWPVWVAVALVVAGYAYRPTRSVTTLVFGIAMVGLVLRFWGTIVSQLKGVTGI